MPTIQQLREEIAKEKKFLDYERNESEDAEEKIKLEKELRSLRLNRKYGKYKPYAEGAKKAFGKIADKFGEVQRTQFENERREKTIAKKGFVVPRRSLFR